MDQAKHTLDYFTLHESYSYKNLKASTFPEDSRYFSFNLSTVNYR